MRVLHRLGVAALVVVAGCSKKLDGPTPSVSGVSPPAICQAQLTSTVELSGAGLAPLVTGALTDSQLELPTVALLRTSDIGGGVASDPEVVIPDAPRAPEKSNVRWLSQEKMSLRLEPGLALTAGLFDINVTNPNKKTGTFAGSLLVVPPPSLTRISPDILCGDKANLVELTGDFFIKGNNTQPMVRFGDKQLAPTSLDNCRPLPGTAGLQACKTLKVALPAKTLMLGAHAVSVINPAPVGCESTQKVTLTMTPEPTLASVVPDLVCTAEGDNTLTLTGTGFLTIDGVTPKLTLAGAPAATLTTTASNCTTVVGPLETVQSCSKLVAVLAKNALPAGDYLANVTCPAPADCSTRQVVKFLVAPPPSLTSIVSDLVCTAEGTNTLTLTGTGFLTVNAVTPTLKLTGATTATLSVVASNCTAVTGLAEPVQRCTTLVATLAKDALPTGDYLATVTNPAPAGCSTPQTISFKVLPPPSLAAVVPDLACTAQGARNLTLSGAGFLTVGTAVPSVSVGTLTLTPTVSGCTPLTGTTLSAQTCTTLTVTVPLATPAGAFPVTVTNPAPAGCSSTPVVGFVVVPPPALTAVVPDLLCTAQGPQGLVVTGDGFLIIDGLAPTLTLAQGATSFAMLTTGSNCTAVTGALEMVRRCTTLTATLPQVGLSPGSYAASVTNPAPAGCTSSAAVGLVVAPAPVLTSAVPEIACTADGAVTVTLTGTNFLTVNAVAPSVEVGTQTLTATASNCTPVTGSLATVTSCTTLTVSVPATIALGAQPVTVRNPQPGGCSSASTQSLTFFGKPAIVDVNPGATCTAGLPATLVVTGSGFVTVGATAPGVAVGSASYSSTASNCTPVVGPTAQVAVCTTLTVASVGSGFALGSYPVTITNPVPVGCTTAPSASSTFQVTGSPTLTAVQPSSVCKGKALLTLTGTNFATNMTVTVGSTPTVDATTVTANSGGTSALASFPPNIKVGGPYSVTVGTGVCSASLPAQVTVTNGPQLFFVDPNVVYNGIAIQATVYGSGVSGSIQSVSITASADGGMAQSLALTSVPGQLNQVQVRLPPGLAPGDYNVELADTTACTATLLNGFHVTATTTLGLAGITPGFGWQNVNTAVTVKATSAGAGFLVLPRAYLSPSTGGAGTAATALGALSFVDARTLTGVVPSGLPVGTYDLIVVNPDQTVGVLPMAFRVVSAAPPTITTLAPGSVSNTNPQTFTISGRDFRMPTVTLSCVDGAGVALATSPAATVTGSTSTTINVSFDASAAGAACVVRVTNTDNNTFADFSALVITNPAQNLYAATFGPNLLVARRAPVALGGDASSSARFLHVIAGDNGTTALDTVESTPLSLLGVPSGFRAQKYKLTTARTFIGGARVGRFLYVAGGSAAGVALATVERAVVLDPDLREMITGLLLDVIPDSSGLGPGVWYYRVAAVMGATDPFNPNGENLPSDPFPLQLPPVTGAGVRVTIQWATQPGAVKYRVYRSPTPGVVPEQLIAEVNAPTTSFTDDGSAVPVNETPLPIGSTGTWKIVATLPVPREGPGVTWGLDPADATRAYLYVLGGRQNSTTALTSYDLVPLTLAADGSQAVGAPVAGTNPLGTARWMLGSSFATRNTSPVIAVGKTYVYALSGFAANGTSLVNVAEGTEVQAGGQLKAWTTLPILNRAGYVNLVAGNFVFAFGGGGGQPTSTTVSGQICAAGVGGCAMSVAPQVANWNAGQAMLSALVSMGGTLHGAFIYITGGVTSTAPLTLTNKTEYRLW